MSETQTAARTFNGVTLPPVGTYVIDQVHSDLSFVARHLMVTKVRGHFRKFSGTIEVAERPEDSKVTATIDAASVDTNEPNRDKHITTADFLDVEHHPTITFESTELIPTGGNEFDLKGDLTIRGITKPVTLKAEFNGVTEHPQMGTRIGLSATTEIAREDWGVSFNAALETGGFMVSKTIRLELEVQASAKA